MILPFDFFRDALPQCTVQSLALDFRAETLRRSAVPTLFCLDTLAPSEFLLEASNN